ncbi:MAG: hypothetical protein HDS79_05080 [Bacteroidales bacterium]|nr:hypothetical protein [Bacteroidales bacterium]
MKKFIFILIFSIISLAAAAKTPNLNVEKLFDGSYNSNPSISIHISKSQGKYFRGCTVSKNKALVDKVSRLFDKDLPRASESHDIIGDRGRYRSMHILNNGEDISVGLSYEGEDGCYIFISGPQKAFQ